MPPLMYLQKGDACLLFTYKLIPKLIDLQKWLSYTKDKHLTLC